MTNDHQLILSILRDAKEHLFSTLHQIKQDDPFAETRILLPSSSAIQDLRSSLDNSVGIHLFQFYSLAEAILLETTNPSKVVSDTAIRKLIRHLLADMNSEGLLTSFSPMQGKPGFVEVLLSWIREMKSQGIHPDEYQKLAQNKSNERDNQLAEFYSRYQVYMNERNIADPDGRLWIAAEALENNSSLFTHNSPLFVLGHDQFTPVQLRILHALEKRFSSIVIYLSWDNHRNHESLALGRQLETKNALLDTLSVEVVKLPNFYKTNPTLSHLVDQLFELPPKISRATDELRMIEAPSREMEVRKTLCEIKKLLIQGISPESIGIFAHSTSVYGPIMNSVCSEYNIPVIYDSILAEEPVVLDLVNLLQIAPEYNWRSTFLALRSAYIKQPWLSLEQIDQLDHLSREQPVLEGREQWFGALQPIQEVFPDFEDEDLGHPPFISTLPEDEIQALKEGLDAFFDHLTPPSEATPHNYTWWIQTKLLGVFPNDNELEEITPSDQPSLQMLDGCKQSPESEHDLLVLSQVLTCLRKVNNSYKWVNQSQDLSWEDYCKDLLAEFLITRIPSGKTQSKILFAPLAEGRVQSFDYLFVLGLSEGEFPTRPDPDVFYANKEREKFSLPIRRDNPENDASLFWQVLSNVNHKLTLVRPYIDEYGAEWQPSPYWDAVKACFDGLIEERIPIADKISVVDAASQNEFLIACAQVQVREVPNEVLKNYQYAQSASKIISQRDSYRPPGEHEGVLISDDILSQLNEIYGSDHVWSASRLNTYGNCPFKFFADNILDLKAHPEPEDGIDVMTRGSLLHLVLEKTLQKIQENGWTLDQENKKAVLEILDSVCDTAFLSAPKRYGFQPTPLWDYEQDELRRMLKTYLDWECEKGMGHFMPFLQEAKFGTKGAVEGAFRVALDEGYFNLRGVIDRIDKDDHENYRVIDYKSGSTPYKKDDIINGLAFQTALYALVAENFMTNEDGMITKSEYRHLPKRSSSGSLSFSTKVKEDPNVQQAALKAFEHIQRIRLGIFPSATEKSIRGQHACTTYCDYALLCRVSRQSISKARKAGLK